MPLFGSSKMQRDGLEVIYRAQGMLEANAVKGRLETSGIPAILDYESAGVIYGITIDGLGEVRVLVPINRADDARLLLGGSIYPEDQDEDSAEPD